MPEKHKSLASAAYGSVVVCVGLQMCGSDLLLDIWIGHHHILSLLQFEWRTFFFFFFHKKEFFFTTFEHHHTVKTNIANSTSDRSVCFFDDVFMKWNHEGGNEGKQCYFRMEGAGYGVLPFFSLYLLIIIILFFPPFSSSSSLPLRFAPDNRHLSTSD